MRPTAGAVLSLARFWRGLVAPGDRIALALSNSLDMAIGLFAAHAAGAPGWCH